MAAEFRFGLVVRGQAEPGENIARRFEETLGFVRLAHRLGYNSITKTAHYSASPFQMLQLVPMLARFTAEAPGMRLNAGVLLLPLSSPLHVAEEFATLDVMSGGKIILGVGLGYRDVEFKAFGVPRAERARRFEDNLVAIRRLWTEDAVSLKVRHFELDQASCSPKPIQNRTRRSGLEPMPIRQSSVPPGWAIAGISAPASRSRPSNARWNCIAAPSTPPASHFPPNCRCAAIFVAKSREEAIRLCAPYLGAKYKAYHAWHQDLPPDDSGFDQEFANLIGDRFFIGSPDEVAAQILSLHRRLGVNHLVMSTEWAGMPESLALETVEMIAKELIPRVRQGL